MTKYIAVFAAVFGVGAGQALAAERSSDSAAPVKLTDGQLDDVVAGDPLIFVNVAVAAPISVHIEPITPPDGAPLPLNRLGTELTPDEKTALGLSPDIAYQYSRLNLDQTGSGPRQSSSPADERPTRWCAATWPRSPGSST